MDIKSAAARMMRLFAGFADAHGTHGDLPRTVPGTKINMKATVRTVRERVTPGLWEAHIRGDRPLGIIPIRADGSCCWGCIDVDRYDLNLGVIATELERMKLPLVVCRSKSGGAHVFLFASEFVAVELVWGQLREIAASMGWGDCEIYPKQSSLKVDKGDLGNWLNMPYLGGDATQRYAVKPGGAAMELEEFLRHAEGRRQTLDQLQDVRPPASQSNGLEDGPPCLQHLTTMGFPEGSRNNGLFGLGVFCQKKFGTSWREVLERYNQDYMRPPLPAGEVADIIKSLDRTEYGYKCKDQPCVSYCNQALCKTRKFGIGGRGLMPRISGVSRLSTDPPLWFVDVDDDRVELSTEQFMNYRLFQKAALDQLSRGYGMMSQAAWCGIYSEALENLIEVDTSPDVGLVGQFRELLEDYLTDRNLAESIEHVASGHPWLDEERGVYVFRLRYLEQFLLREGFKVWGRNTISTRLREMGGGKEWLNIPGRRGYNVFWLPVSVIGTPDPPLPLPQSKGTPI